MNKHEENVHYIVDFDAFNTSYIILLVKWWGKVGSQRYTRVSVAMEEMNEPQQLEGPGA